MKAFSQILFTITLTLNLLFQAFFSSIATLHSPISPPFDTLPHCSSYLSELNDLLRFFSLPHNSTAGKMRNNAFIQLQTIRLAQSATIERSAWTSCKKIMSLPGSNERFWTELRGDVILLYPGSLILNHFKKYMSRRGFNIQESGPQVLLETLQEDMKPKEYASMMHNFASRVPKTKVVPVLFRLCKKVADFEKRTIVFTAYNASAIPHKTITLTYDTDEEMKLWLDVICKAPEVYQKTLSDFSLIQHIGHGATSEVFLVRDRFSHEKLAMKAIDKKGVFPQHDSVRRIIDERIVNARMRKHPYILQMSRAFETPESLYVATEFCSRGDLFHYLRRNGGRVSEEIARMVTAEVLLALDGLHDQGIWYRDLKPENVMVADNGHVKLGDFGAAKITDPRQPTPLSNSTVGTVEYLAPEMVREKSYDRKVDLWAFGIFLCELLNGETPFESDTEKLTYENIKNSPIVLPLTMPAEARDLVRQLLHRNPSKRLGSSVNGWEDVKAHPWFEGIDWELLLLRPALTGPFGSYQSQDESPRISEECSADEPSPADWKKKIAYLKFAADLKRDYKYTETIRSTSDCESRTERIPRHPLWANRNLKQTFGGYACGERRNSSAPLSEESPEPLGILNPKNGNISYVTEGQWQSGSKSPRYREGSDTGSGFWRKLVSSFEFWRKK